MKPGTLHVKLCHTTFASSFLQLEHKRFPTFKCMIETVRLFVNLTSRIRYSSHHQRYHHHHHKHKLVNLTPTAQVQQPPFLQIYCSYSYWCSYCSWYYNLCYYYCNQPPFLALLMLSLSTVKRRHQ